MIETQLFQQAKMPYPLRPYQLQAVGQFLKYRHGTVVLPTGSGKTSIALDAMIRLQLRTAIIVPTEALLNQWVKNLKDINVYAGVFYGKEKRHGAATVFIINSATNHREMMNTYKMQIYDEVHHIGSTDFSRLIPYVQAAPYALGLTSHLARMDGRENLIKKVMPIIFTMRIANAMKSNYISNIKIVTVKAEMTQKERETYCIYSEKIRMAYFKLGTTNPAVLSKMKNNPIALMCLSAMVRRKMLLSQVIDKQHKVMQLANMYPQERVLVFSESILGIDMIYKHFQKYNKPTGIYHSQVDDDKKHQMLQQWKDHKIQVLPNVKSLDEGIDVPKCRVAIIVATGTSHRQLIQRIGRITRKRLDGSSGLLFIVYCADTVEARYAEKIKWIIENE